MDMNDETRAALEDMNEVNRVANDAARAAIEAIVEKYPRDTEDDDVVRRGWSALAGTYVLLEKAIEASGYGEWLGGLVEFYRDLNTEKVDFGEA